jgi:hypothetical protein
VPVATVGGHVVAGRTSRRSRRGCRGKHRARRCRPAGTRGWDARGRPGQGDDGGVDVDAHHLQPRVQRGQGDGCRPPIPCPMSATCPSHSRWARSSATFWRIDASMPAR